MRSSNGNQVPLSAFTHYETKNTALSVNHQGQFPAVTISFNLGEGVALGDAVTKIQAAVLHMGLPADIHPTFQGNAQAFQSSLSTQPWLILAALVAVYIVLGMLYESYVHPVTILSTLPSAGVGALLALLAFHNELTVIALIGIILLIGIVKKNAIMMIDFAIEAERTGKTPEESIYQACLLRFRPIMMTTMAALFGGLPLALLHRHRFGNAPPPRNQHCWRLDGESSPYSLYDSGYLLVYGPSAIAHQAEQGSPAAETPGARAANAHQGDTAHLNCFAFVTTKSTNEVTSSTGCPSLRKIARRP